MTYHYENQLKAKPAVSKDSDYYKRNELPVDRGWSWVICFAGFLMSFNLGLANQTMSILFLEVKELFDATLTKASLIFLCYVLGAGLMSAISTNLFVPKFGEKRVCCVTGVIYSLASVGFSLAPRIEVFLCCSAIKGICMGAIFVPSISLIRHYFHRRRSVAQMLGRAGASAAGIVMPPLIRAIRYEYGIRGTFLIVGAIELHIAVAGLLLRPVQSYKFKPDLPPLPNQIKKKKEMKKDEEPVEQDSSKPLSQGDSKVTNHRPNDINKTVTLDTQSDVISYKYDTNAKESKDFNSPKSETTEGLLLGYLRENGDMNRKNIHENGITLTVLNKTSNGVRNDDVTAERTKGLHAPNGEESVTFLQHSLKPPRGSAKNSRSHDAHALSSTMSLASVGVPEESVVPPDLDNEDKEDDQEEQPGCGKYKFFSQCTFRMVLVFGAMGAGNMYIKNYVPTIAVSQGATLDQAAMLLTLIGVLDFSSRVSLGFFADTHLLKPSQIVAISHVVLGLTCQLSRFFNTFPTLVIMSSVIGIFIGTRISMIPLICIEVVGVEMMPQAFSIVTSIGTFSAAAMNPSFGAVADSFGNFIPVLHILGVFFFLSAAVLLMLPIGRRVDKRNGNQFE